jgi:membrane-associated phospholipid phosphatase
MMQAWHAATATFFLYIAVAAAFMPRLDAVKRRLAFTGAAIGVTVTFGSYLIPHPVLNDWVLPPLVLLVGYWTSGLLFVAPMPRAECRLLAIDRKLRVTRIAAGAPRLLAELLELAYAAVYPVIPIALIVYLVTIGAQDAGRFWTVILVTDYICFGMLPWVQTRPPRALEAGSPWLARFRAVNLRLLGKTSIQVNTFPSGHAAEALAAALLVIAAPAPVVVVMFLIAAAISVGAVLGRYHYAADVLAGWAVAMAVWLAVM